MSFSHEGMLVIACVSRCRDDRKHFVSLIIWQPYNLCAVFSAGAAEYDRREELRQCRECPPPGTRIAWHGPSVFNNESLLRTVIERKTHTFKLENPYRPDQREPLPILHNHASDGSAAQ